MSSWQIRFVAGLLCAGWISSGARAAGDLDYYLDLQCVEGGGSVTVNGFPLFGSGIKGAGFSTWLTPYLRPGDNEITVHFRSLPEKLNASMEFSVVSHPHDGKARSDELKKVLARGKLAPRHRTWLTELPAERLQVLSGKRGETGGLVFAPGEDGQVVFGVHFPDAEDHLVGRPLSLDYVGLSHALTQVEIHFLQRDGPAHLEFGGMALQPGIKDVPIKLEDLRSGIEWVAGAEFDTVWIVGQALGLEEGESVTVTSCELDSIESKLQVTRRFKLPGPMDWAWMHGEDVGKALADPAQRAALIARLEEIHGIVNERPFDEWLPLFAAKTSTYAKGMYQELGVIQKSQRAFFERLANTKNWALEPFQPGRLQVFPVNDRVVRVRYADSEGPLISVPLMKPNARRPNRFTIPLYLSLIDGQWQIVL